MYILIRLSPYLVGITTLVSLVLILKDIKSFFGLIILAALFLVLFVYLITKNKIESWGKLNFILIPLLFQLSSFLFLFFLEGYIIQYIFVVLVSFLLGLSLEKILIFLWQPEKHKPRQLADILVFFCLLILFFTSVSLFSLSVYLSYPKWILLSVILFFLALISYLGFWSNKIDFKNGFVWQLVVVVVFFELFFLIDLWPFSFYVKGILFISLYYFVNLLAIRKLSSGLSPKIAWRTGLLVLLIWVAILLTARH